MKKNPLNSVIDYLKNVNFMKSPIHKLKLFNLTGKICLSSIIDYLFSKKLENYVNEITENEISSFFLYCIVKGNFTSIISHCNFIENLLNKNQNFNFDFYNYYELINNCAIYLSEKLIEESSILSIFNN